MNQFLGTLIRVPGFPRKRGVWSSQGRGKNIFFVHYFVLVNVTVHFSLTRTF